MPRAAGLPGKYPITTRLDAARAARRLMQHCSSEAVIIKTFETYGNYRKIN